MFEDDHSSSAVRARRPRPRNSSFGIAALDGASDEQMNRRHRKGAKERVARDHQNRDRHPGGDLLQVARPDSSPHSKHGTGRRDRHSIIVKEEGVDRLGPPPGSDVSDGVHKGLADLTDELDDSSKGSLLMAEAEHLDLLPKTAAPGPVERKEVGGGFVLGDKVVSLISRVRGGLLVLELGHEGTVVGANGGGDSGEALRLLVQFVRGYDWLLAPCQVCTAASLASAKAAGLPSYNWGTRVRSLVTYLKPSRAKRELGLGDAGTVIGPGASLGKLAVRFDDCGEWSVWPNAICKAETYTTTVQERLFDSFCRGERVRSLTTAAGRRSQPARGEGPHSLVSGANGTVVGPGHKSGWLLVHFDSDERLWSLNSKNLQRCG